MRKITMLGAVVGALACAPAAHAADPITKTFGGALNCTTQVATATAGQRWCGTSANQGAQQGTAPSTVPSFDGAPIDATVALPPTPATGPDGGFPVVGIYHGYGGFKVSLGSAAAQRWLKQGYAVFTMTDRGFWGSCGVLVPNKPASCDKAYIHLMDNAWEVHDAQYLMGLLADDGAIDPQRIGATGASYGGGMSAQLGALKNRVQNVDGSLVPWTSPVKKLPMQIAATAPNYGWSDLVQSLVPNGSGLDYAAKNPYVGPAGDRRFGVMKNIWNLALYGGGLQTGTYAAPFADPTANITVWLESNRTGGPYDRTPVILEQLAAFPRHGSYGTDDSIAPAPTLLSNGWNDDLFPVDEALRYYNKTRATHPETPIKLIGLDFGHGNRASVPTAADAKVLSDAEDAWFAKYVRGDGATPDDAAGGVTAVTSACAPATSETYRAKTWAALAPGEIHLDGAATKTVAPDTQPAEIYSPSAPGGTAPTVCTTGPSTNTPGAAVYETAPAPEGGFTIAGSPTILADLTVKNANDAVIGRLLDVDVAAGTQRLIARGTYRPTGTGTSRQVFQLHPQAWKVQAGHTVKLELLGRDAPYALAQTGQAPYDVSNLQLRLPTIDAPGAAGGLVQTPAAKVLPKGYELAADLPKPAPPVVEAPAPTTPAPAPAPAPAVPAPAVRKDALTPDAALKVLKTAPGRYSITRSLRTLKFADRIPEAGTQTYVLTMKVGGKVRTIGRSVRRVTKDNRITVTIRPTAAGRRLLKARPRTTLTLKTTFVTAVERKTLSASRTLRRR